MEKGYAQRIVINKSENTLKMFVKPQYIRTVFNMSAQQVGTSPWVSVQFGSVDELEKFLDIQQQKHKFAGYSYDNEHGTDIWSILINLAPLLFFFFLFWMLSRGMGGGAGLGGGGGIFNVGKSKAKLYERKRDGHNLQGCRRTGRGQARGTGDRRLL